MSVENLSSDEFEFVTENGDVHQKKQIEQPKEEEPLIEQSTDEVNKKLAPLKPLKPEEVEVPVIRARENPAVKIEETSITVEPMIRHLKVSKDYVPIQSQKEKSQVLKKNWFNDYPELKILRQNWHYMAISLLALFSIISILVARSYMEQARELSTLVEYNAKMCNTMLTADPTKMEYRALLEGSKKQIKELEKEKENTQELIRLSIEREFYNYRELRSTQKVLPENLKIELGVKALAEIFTGVWSPDLLYSTNLIKCKTLFNTSEQFESFAFGTLYFTREGTVVSYKSLYKFMEESHDGFDTFKDVEWGIPSSKRTIEWENRFNNWGWISVEQETKDKNMSTFYTIHLDGMLHITTVKLDNSLSCTRVYRKLIEPVPT